jgi:hypothetical protein
VATSNSPPENHSAGTRNAHGFFAVINSKTNASRKVDPHGNHFVGQTEGEKNYFENFSGDLDRIAREIIAASEEVLSKKSQTRDNILKIKDQLLTAYGNGLSLARMAEMLAERGLKCSAPTLREILGLRKKKPEENGGEEGGKSARGFERNGEETGGKIRPQNTANQTVPQAADGANGGRIPAFKSRGEL